MNADRAERSRLRERHDLEDDHAPRAPRDERSAAQRGADRMDQLIATSTYDHTPPRAFDGMAPEVPACDYTEARLKRCEYEVMPGAQLFIKGKGDIDEVDANDVGQERIGDCHLLGPTMALLQAPEGRQRVREMMKEVQRDGKTVYQVAFRVPVDLTAAQWMRSENPYREVQVEVSGDFIQGHARVGDAAGDKNEVWPMVLEAAYAKLRAGYPSIHGGQPDRAFEAITGAKAQTKTLEAGTLSYSASDLRKDVAAGKPITVSFTWQGKEKTTAPAMSHYGCSGFHAYALGATFEKGGVTYVQLRNPWGAGTDPKPIPLRELEELAPRIDIGAWP